ncbi:MAG: hypothetical protein JW862_09425, partial [Anaerolineales bacterium]|nr:hypothetical protein [Anaerolineales bacterium]
IELGKQLVNLAGEQPSQPLALAHRVLGSGYLFQGNFPAARRHLETALTVNQASQQAELQWWIHGDFEAVCRAMLGFVLTVHGYPEQGWQQILQALNRGRQLKRLSSLGSALIFGFEVASVRKDLAALQMLTRELLQLGQTDAEELHFFRAYAYSADGYLQAIQAEPGSKQAQAGINLVQKGMQLWQATGTLAGWGQWVVRLADACLQSDHFERGLETIMPALENPDNQGFGAGLTRIHWLQGELLLKLDPANRDEAEANFMKALEIARQQEAHSLELAAAISLAKLWQTERPAQARQLLSETCAWFTEGFETRDWLEAQELLNAIPA